LTTNHFYLLHSAPIFLFFAALLAGALNSVAGGGSFISFPALLFAHMAPIAANATSTAALWPGTLASTIAYRRELAEEKRQTILPLLLSALIGGFLGAQILLHTPPATFLRLVPWLLLSATLLFVVSPYITSWIRVRSSRSGGSRLMTVGVTLLQLVVGVYIGYFGAGSGIMILALLALLGVTNIHAMNGLKTMLVTVGNAVALVTFIVARIIVWPQALLMLVGASIGGYGGAYFAQKMDPLHIRRVVIVVGLAMSLYFFIRH
jgi:uncharacterized membrane protein YfcA